MCNRKKVIEILNYIKYQMIKTGCYEDNWDDMKLKIYVIVFNFDKAMFFKTAKTGTGLTYIKGIVPHPRDYFFEGALRKVFSDMYDIPRWNRHLYNVRIAKKYLIKDYDFSLDKDKIGQCRLNYYRPWLEY